MKAKRIITMIAAAAVAISVAGCGSSSGKTGGAVQSGSQAASADVQAGGSNTAVAGVLDANADPKNTETSDETVTIAFSAEPSGLWGAGTGKVENEAQMVDAAIMDGLVSVDRSTGEVVPRLAKSWDWVDSTHCKFTLRDDVTMTDGTPLVADDVVYSVNCWMEYSASSDTGRFLTGAEADDEHTVTIGFNTEAPDMLYMLAWSNFGIVTEDEVNALGGPEAADKKPLMGVGRYKFKEWKNGQYITLERNDNYYDKDYKGYFKEIKLIFVADAASREMSVESGDIQVAYDMPLNTAVSFVGNPSDNVIAYSFGQVTHLWYNMGDKAGATKDLRVRQAIDKAIDFDAVANVGTAGFSGPALGYFEEDSPYYTATFTTEERKQDIEGAKELLKEAGYADGLDIKIVGMQDMSNMFTVLQESLRQAGINLTIDIVDTPQFVQAANGGDYDIMCVGDLCDARYPAMMPFFIQSCIDNFNIGGSKYTTPEIEAQVKAFIAETDRSKAKEEAAALEQTWKKDMYFSNMYKEMKAAITAKDIKGYYTIERGFMDLTTLYK
ncbi:MAG: ABC transporter substrate-binding protein [Bilifractor sp.]|nr:ABC transporter substrate-binding protein [Lachnospiraceae bacterium]MDY2836720.1 ABC transporter substrate-binding protein [Bilifractor sp.]